DRLNEDQVIERRGVGDDSHPGAAFRVSSRSKAATSWRRSSTVYLAAAPRAFRKALASSIDRSSSAATCPRLSLSARWPSTASASLTARDKLSPQAASSCSWSVWGSSIVI